MEQINVYAAKTQLSRLLDRVENGEEILISRAGRPVAILAPYRPAPARRTPGAWRNQVWIADDFDALPEDMAAAFRGEHA